MLGPILLKLSGFVLLSSVVVASGVIQLDLYNKNQYKEIYVYGYVTDVAPTSPVELTATARSAPNPPEPAAVNPAIEGNIQKTSCKLGNQEKSYLCSLQKSKLNFLNNQIDVKAIMNAKQEGVVSLTKDDFVQIDISGESTGFQNTKQDINVEYWDHEDKQHQANIRVLFSTSKNGVNIISKSPIFVSKPVLFDNSAESLSKNDKYECAFTKDGVYQKCKVYDFANDNGENHTDLSFIKPTTSKPESAKIEKNKNYIIQFIYKEFLPNHKTLFIKSNNVKVEMQYIQAMYDGSSDKIITLPSE